jgi:FMN reductase
LAKVVIVSGSASEVSRLEGVLAFVESKLKESGLNVQVLNVRDLPAEALLHLQFNHPEIVNSVVAIEGADAIIVATPIYKASYSGVVKAFLDLLPQKALKGKVVFPLAIGGSPAHLLAIDYALKPVLGALGATHFFQGVYTIDADVTRHEDNSFSLNDAIQARLTDHLAEYIEEIQWKKEDERCRKKEIIYRKP